MIGSAFDAAGHCGDGDGGIPARQVQDPGCATPRSRHPQHAAGWVRHVLPHPLATTLREAELAPIRERFPGFRLRPAATRRVATATADEIDVWLDRILDAKTIDDVLAR